MGSVPNAPERPKPWIETPCLRSAPLSRIAGCNIYLKLENLQPSGSFKSRGVGNLMFRAIDDSTTTTTTTTTASTTTTTSEPSTPDPRQIHFYCSSGGNAGLACATAAIDLGRKATIVVPMTTTSVTITKLRDLGADVVQYGAGWAAADKHMREVVMHVQDPAQSRAIYVPPFDHPHIWEGASYMVPEILGQLGPSRHVDAVVCSVGGGGLLCGIMQGLHDAGQGKIDPRTKVLAMETTGADSLNASVRAGEHVTLQGITSIANSLGAVRVCTQAFEWSQKCPGTLVSAVVSDRDAVIASARFLDNARFLVEPACSATIAPVYNGELRGLVGGDADDEEWSKKNVVLVVCGGSNITLEALQGWMENFDVRM